MEESDDEQDKETHRGNPDRGGRRRQRGKFWENEVKGIVRDEREPKKHIIR